MTTDEAGMALVRYLLWGASLFFISGAVFAFFFARLKDEWLKYTSATLYNLAAMLGLGASLLWAYI